MKRTASSHPAHRAPKAMRASRVCPLCQTCSSPKLANGDALLVCHLTSQTQSLSVHLAKLQSQVQRLPRIPAGLRLLHSSLALILRLRSSSASTSRQRRAHSSSVLTQRRIKALPSREGGATPPTLVPSRQACRHHSHLVRALRVPRAHLCFLLPSVLQARQARVASNSVPTRKEETPMLPWLLGPTNSALRYQVAPLANRQPAPLPSVRLLHSLHNLPFRSALLPLQVASSRLDRSV